MLVWHQLLTYNEWQADAGIFRASVAQGWSGTSYYWEVGFRAGTLPAPTLEGVRYWFLRDVRTAYATPEEAKQAAEEALRKCLAEAWKEVE